MMSVGAGMEVFIIPTPEGSPQTIDFSRTLFYDGLGVSLPVGLQHYFESSLGGQWLGMSPATGGTDVFLQDVSFSTVFAADYTYLDNASATVRSSQSSTTDQGFSSNIIRGTWCRADTPSNYALTNSTFFADNTPLFTPPTGAGGSTFFSPTTDEMPSAGVGYGDIIPSASIMRCWGAYPAQQGTISVSGMRFYRF